ncbi:unnamed protein product [Rotaria socialis]
MISKSILIDLTNCTIADRSKNANNVNSKDSHRTQSSLSNITTTHEHDPGSESDEVLGDDTHYINNNNKKLKAAKNKATAISRNNYLTTTTIETTSVQSSQVWKYAIRCPNSNFSICSLCLNDKKVSTNNGSTSTLRKHLISEHQLHELALPNNKRYEHPTRYSVARLLKRLHKLHLKKLINDLALIGDISITLDLWSNKQMRSFLVITGHYFNKNGFDLQSTVLNFSTLNVHHNSVDILRVLQEKLKELDILHNVVRVTSDGGRNVVRAIRDLHLNLEYNLNHGLNDAEKEMANIDRLDNNDDIGEPDEINMNVTRDESDDDELSETYDSNDEEELLLKATMKNSWMIGQQIYKHQLKIQPKQVKKLADYELTSDDWNVLLVLHSILKPFYHATKVMSGGQYPSIGLAFYLLTRLKNFLQHNDRKESSMEKRLKQLLLKQFFALL